ncbi:MAG TPA: tetratricopeptide repeat protein [Terriglobales bacterium]
MKRKLTYAVMLGLLFAIVGANVALAQYTATVSGRVTDDGKPQAGVQVINTNASNGRQFKMKTDKNGGYSAIGVPFDNYNVTVVNASGENVYTHKNLNVGQSGGDIATVWDIDLTKGGSGKQAGGAGGGTMGQTAAADANTKGQPKVTTEEVEKIKASNAKAEGINALITQYNAAAAAKDWKSAVPPLQGMIAADPTRWEYLQALGNAQLNEGDYEESIKTYEQGVTVAQGYVSGTTARDPKNPNSDPAKAKAGIGQMYASQGSAYLKLHKNEEAIAAFNKAAELDPNPAVAYFNICATQYNVGNMAGAAAACDKAIAADPNKADAYFIKGSALYGDGKLDANNKYVVPPGTAEALNKYLALAPDGGHAADVKAMLEAIGAKIETSYGNKKKK